MRITRIQVTIEPWFGNSDLTSLRVEVRVDGRMFTTQETVSKNDFESVFSQLLDVAKRTIKCEMNKPTAADKP